MLGLFEFGLLGVVFIIIFLLLLPFIVTLIVGVAFANMLGFTGLTWWAFVILFYLVISGILGRIGL